MSNHYLSTPHSRASVRVYMYLLQPMLLDCENSEISDERFKKT